MIVSFTSEIVQKTIEYILLQVLKNDTGLKK